MSFKKEAQSMLRHKDSQLLISRTIEFPGVKPWGPGFEHSYNDPCNDTGGKSRGWNSQVCHLFVSPHSAKSL